MQDGSAVLDGTDLAKESILQGSTVITLYRGKLNNERHQQTENSTRCSRERDCEEKRRRTTALIQGWNLYALKIKSPNRRLLSLVWPRNTNSCYLKYNHSWGEEGLWNFEGLVDCGWNDGRREEMRVDWPSVVGIMCSACWMLPSLRPFQVASELSGGEQERERWREKEEREQRSSIISIVARPL